MSKLSQFFRLIHINLVCVRYGLDQLLFSLPWFSPLRFITKLNPWYWVRQQEMSRGLSLKLALIQLGPIFVKFGQALSTRPDLIPEDIIVELSSLQDRVPPFTSEMAVNLIEKVYHQPLDTVFAEFDRIPLASASIAQVHAAKLFDGRSVVVKIIRPNIEKIIKRDIQLLYTLARLAERYLQDGKRLRPVAAVAEFEKSLLDELDLMREAANASQLRRHFTGSSMLYVPEVYWPYVREKVLVMERIHGIPITNLSELDQWQINRKKLAERGVAIFFTQVFRDGFFHADMHPGNIFVGLNCPDDPQYICVDFGIMGTLDKEDKRYLAENFYAFFQRDYRRVAELHLESGWVPAQTRITELEAAIRTVCEPIFERPLKEISCALTLMKLFQTGRRFHMKIQPQLLLLQKTLFSIEGLGRQLDPDLDLWRTAKPYLEQWLREEASPFRLANKIGSTLPQWLHQLHDLPFLLHTVLQQQKEYNKRQAEQAHKREEPHNPRRYFLWGIAISLLIGGGLIRFLNQPLTQENQLSILSLGAVIGLVAWSVKK